MSDEERTGSCIVCQKRDPLPDLVPVCGPCRSRVANQLEEVPLLCLLLAAGSRPQVVAGDLTEVRELVRALADEDLLAELEDTPAGWFDAAVRTRRALHIEAAPVAGQPGAPRVGGSREAPMPIRGDAHDLLDIADERMVGDYHQVPMVRSTGEKQWQLTWFDGKPVWQQLRVREVVSVERKSVCRCGHPELHKRRRPVMVPAADQVGKLSVASVLNSWCRDWCERRREVGVEPVVLLLARWLADRLDWAFAEHDAVDEFAGELDDVWHALRTAGGLPRPQPELCEGIPCSNCDLRLLYRVPGSRYVECDPERKYGGCQALLTESEFDDWVKLLRAPLCGRRNGDWWCALAKKHDGDCEPYGGDAA